ncbi:hypothetical protein swp_2104 [Shewanella piezotolerans WP3]|uniref:Uncharacterized protein n=1 Tax=Shewanella piezotolerans (strain WP3 / JCM 13877) TaxID=225849 RepID=B8CLT4_SHEPW|nr:hypothetical protein swp_2104 [Shewanella piezotolerans WP3]
MVLLSGWFFIVVPKIIYLANRMKLSGYDGL